MAFTGKTEGITYAPGYFLANNEDCTRLTKNFKTGDGDNITIKKDKHGNEYVPMGSIYKEETTPVGIVYEDVDLSYGEAAGSVVTAGTVYKDRLEETAKTEVTQIDTITVLDEPKVTRPTYDE